jgi:hypothetical protein
MGGSAARPRHCSSQRKRDRVITFLLPSCFLALSGFRFNPVGGRVLKSEWGIATGESGKKKE